MIREAQVPLGSAVYSLRAWAYARAVAPTLKNEFRGRTGCLSHIPRRAGARPGAVEGGPRRQRRTGARSTAHVPTESLFGSGLEAVVPNWRGTRLFL